MAVYKTIGKYEVRQQIGRGAMGIVFEAFDPAIERRVAIKALRLEIFEQSQLADVRARFKREAQSAGRMSHPHIVTVYDYGEHEGTPYIVMEHMVGSELSKILERGTRLPLPEVVRLMTQLLGALAYAHERKVVHRDVKPGNIFVLDDGSLKVVDFGIARVEASNLTDTGALLGTPAYMSPEQFLALAIDERSDIFSAGVILYELLTGDKPFTGSVTTIMQKVLHQDPIQPSVLNPLLPSVWDAVVKRAMAKKPEARFQSARQFAETIKQAFNSGTLRVSVEATLPGAPGTTALSSSTLGSLAPQISKASASAKTHAPSPSDSAVARRARGARLIGIGLTIAVAAGVALYYARPQVASERAEDTSRAGEPSQAAGERPVTGVPRTEGATSEKPVAETREEQERAAREKAATERAAADKQALEKEAAEKMARIKATRERETAERAAAEAKSAAQRRAEKLAAERAALARAAAEKSAQERAAAENAAQERVAAERAAEERAAAEKAAQEKAAAERAAANLKCDGLEPGTRKGDASGLFRCVSGRWVPVDSPDPRHDK